MTSGMIYKVQQAHVAISFCHAGPAIVHSRLLSLDQMLASSVHRKWQVWAARYEIAEVDQNGITSVLDIVPCHLLQKSLECCL